MERNEQIKIGKDLIYLVSCALNGEKANSIKIDSMDLEKVYKMAKKHLLAAMSFLPIEDVPFDNRDKYGEVLSKWKESKEKAVRKEVYLEIEKKEIEAFFNERKIWYVLLKGVVLKYLYPKTWCREMADVDILFDVNYRNAMKNFMQRKGYKIKSFKLGNHDVYMKPPVYNFEMHIALYNSVTNDIWEQYYENIKCKLINDDAEHYEYRFSVDDFYIYITTHTFKHFDGGGNGIRSLLDTYIYLNRYENEMNWDYIEEQMKYLGILEFENQFRILAKKVFSKEEIMCAEEKEMFKYLMYSGAYGYKEKILERLMEKHLEKIQNNKERFTVRTKVMYIINRLFPSIKMIKYNHQFIYKTKIFIPFFYVYRLIMGLIIRGKDIFKELKMLFIK